MTQTIIFGASDGLIEVEGAISEEFAGGDEPRYLGFSNGTVLKVTYDNDGIWRIQPVRVGGCVDVKFARGEEDGDDKDGCPGYSDKAIIGAPVEWVVCGDSWAKS